MRSFSALAVLLGAVEMWNILTVEGTVAKLRAEGHELPDKVLTLTPLLRKHINPFGRFHFDLSRLRS